MLAYGINTQLNIYSDRHKYTSRQSLYSIYKNKKSCTMGYIGIATMFFNSIYRLKYNENIDNR